MRYTMNARKTLLGLAMAAALAVALGAARHAWISPPAPIIATVDIERVINELKESRALRTQLTDMAARNKEKIEGIARNFENEREKLKLLPPDAKAEQRALMASLDKMRFQAEFEKQFASREEALSEGRMVLDLYNKVVDTCAIIAKREGVTMVIASDENIQIAGNSPADITRAIALRRMLYVDARHDITDQVVTEMNNAYDAGAKTGKNN